MSGFLPYGRQWVDDEDIAAVVAVLKSDFLTQGPAVELFEDAIKKATGAKYCVAVANATAGLHISVAALGIKSGAEGITTPITFAASGNCMVYNGLRPKFSDIDVRTYCLDPQLLERNIGPQTRVVIPVDFAGQAADMAAIRRITAPQSIYVIEDAAHAIGSYYPDGSAVGSCTHSDMTVFSFHPVKTITTGEGGAVTTNDEVLYRRLLLLRSHGITRDASLLGQNPGPWYYEMQELGFNYRMTDIQAALGTSQLRKLPSLKKRRQDIVAAYNRAFAGSTILTTPFEAAGADSCFHLYVIKVDFSAIHKGRAQVMAELKALSVGTQVHYIPLHLQPYYRQHFGYRPGDFPIAEEYYDCALSLPLFPMMNDDDVDRVLSAVKKVCA